MKSDEPVDRRRRELLLGAGALALSGYAAQPAAATPAVPTIDMHCHAGTVLPSRAKGFDRPFSPVAQPMRAGGMDVICLAVVSDTAVTRVENGLIRAWREPAPGELYDWALQAHARAQELIAREGLEPVLDAASLQRAVGTRRGVIIASESADFLEGRVDRVDEFYERHELRHLQLTHYRVNELGDIQTAPRVHHGLTDFGRAVVRRCNERGLVVDVAHAPYETVQGVVETATKPIVLSHTSLSPALRPPTYTRLISSDHARLVASTGGVVGVWPPAAFFPTLAAMATGMARMADVIGVDHVGLGTDLLGLVGPSVFDSYAELPQLADALRATGFGMDDIAKILGGNYARVFAASMADHVGSERRMNLMNAWYVAATSDEVVDRPLGRRICDRAMVFYRGLDRGIRCVEDFCPHRGAPLSLGTVRDGHLVCGYHGLVMGGDGRCVAMPGVRAPRMPGIPAFPVVERHGFVWVWPGEADAADESTLPAPHWAGNDAWAYGGGLYRVGCDYRLMIDNLMDLTHETYVHATSIGQPEIEEAPVTTTVDGDHVVTSRFMSDIQAPPFWRAALRGNGLADDVLVDRWQICHFTPPSHVMIEVGVAHAGHGGYDADAAHKVSSIVVDFITPESPTSIWYFWGMARNFNVADPDLTETIRAGQARIFGEDLAMLERQQKNITEWPERKLTTLAIDAGGMHARRVIDRLVAAERGCRQAA